MEVKNKYPWNQIEQEVYKYFTNTFSTDSRNKSRMPPRIHLLNTKNFEIQRKITKENKNKTMVFRLVLQRNVNGYNIDPFGNKSMPQSFRYIQLLDSQKRNYSYLSSKKFNLKKGNLVEIILIIIIRDYFYSSRSRKRKSSKR